MLNGWNFTVERRFIPVRIRQKQIDRINKGKIHKIAQGTTIDNINKSCTNHRVTTVGNIKIKRRKSCKRSIDRGNLIRNKK